MHIKHRYLITASDISLLQSKALEKWITDSRYEQYQLPEYLLASPQLTNSVKHGRYLYRFMLAETNCQVVMKVRHLSKPRRWIRRLRDILKYYLRQDVTYKAFRCCERAYLLRLAAPKPLAYWQRREGFGRVKGYFLYQYVDNSILLSEVCEKLKVAGDGESKWRMDLLKKIIGSVKDFHQAGIRHNDMAAHNILISTTNLENLSTAKVCFIDYDRHTLVRLNKPAFLKKFFDLINLRKIRIDNVSLDDVLNLYLGTNRHYLWSALLIFMGFKTLSK